MSVNARTLMEPCTSTCRNGDGSKTKEHIVGDPAWVRCQTERVSAGMLSFDSDDPLEQKIREFADRISGRPFGSQGFTVKGGDIIQGEWDGSIYDANGECVGDFKRTFRDDGVVAHNNMYIHEDHHRTGFGTAFNEAAYELYRELGFHTVTVCTDDDGSYVWAKAGFEFDDDAEYNMGADARKSIPQAMEDTAPSLNDADRERVLRMAADFRAGNPTVTIQDIANLTADNARNLGEQILKSGVSWPGKKNLLA